MAERAAVFDVMGTIFDLSSLQPRLEALGAPRATLQAWFGRTLHHTAALTLADEFRPFEEILAAALRSTLEQLGLDAERASEVLAGMGELEPYPEALAAMDRLQESGVSITALTNGGERNTRTLLEQAGLDGYLERVVTTADVRAYKPHPAPYRRALDELGLPAERATLVAAHAWDVVGARAVGMNTVWVDRLERRWPLPVPEAPRAGDLLEAAAIVTAQ